MNAAIRAVVRTGLVNNFETYIVNDGYKGLFEDHIVQLFNVCWQRRGASTWAPTKTHGTVLSSTVGIQ